MCCGCAGQWAVEQAGLMDEFRAKARPEGQDTRVMDKDGTVLWEETGSTQMDRPEVSFLAIFPLHQSHSVGRFCVLLLISLLPCCGA